MDVLAGRRALTLLAICVGLQAASVRAGAQDAGVDTLAHIPPVDTLAARPPLARVGTGRPERPAPDWFPAPPGTRQVDRPMARTRFTDAAEALAEDQMTFLYRMGIPGRPSGWSLGALPPSVAGATLDGFEFVDPLTRLPLLELLPVELLEPISTTWSRPGVGPSVSAHTRPLAGRPPLTEIRYDQGSNKLQSVSVFHSQDRTRTVRGKPTRLNLLFRYGGRGSTAAYPGSKTRLRQVYFRFLHERPGRLLEAGYLHTSSRRDGQSGVLPAPGRDLDSIYETFSPTVRTPGAGARTDRHDLTLRLRKHLHSVLPPLTAGIRFSPQINRVTLPGAGYRMVSFQAATFVTQPLAKWGRHHPEIVQSARIAAIRGNLAFADTSAARYVDWSVGLRDSTTTLGGRLHLDVALQSTSDGLRPRVQVSFSRKLKPASLRVEAAWGHRNPSHVDRQGFGNSVVGLNEPRTGSVFHLQTSARVRVGSFTWESGLFASSYTDPIDYQATTSLLANSATLAMVVQEDAAYRWSGASGRLDWRRTARAGLFARADVVYTRPSASMAQGAPNAAEALPRWRGEQHLGIRSRLFQGDLLLTAFLRGREWSAFRSRSFQPETGLFFLPAADDLLFGPSGSLDLVAEGGIRGATLYLSFDNLLSGSLYPGTLVVPIYPLPQRAIRFGIYWPLLD